MGFGIIDVFIQIQICEITKWTDTQNGIRNIK